MNLRWSWDQRTRDLFRWVDPDLWETCEGDPMRILDEVSPARLAELAEDASFLAFMEEVRAELVRHVTGPNWFGGRQSPLSSVAYFSPEFAITEALPQYSGGLGVLAGDHLKAASELGLPLVGVGLFYRQGYFMQHVNTEGRQHEHYPTQDPHSMPVEGTDELRISVELAGSPLYGRVWRAEVGKISLYLLDTDCDENDGERKRIADRLYGGDVEHRLQQEILLGIGGVRALEAMGIRAQVFHTNEGHAGFQGLERIRTLVTKEGLGFDEALEAVRASTLFTTHTPVPAGIDRFSEELMRKYFSSFAEECGIGFERLMELGHAPGDEPSAPFNMAVMGLHLAGMSNGVSKLHGEVSRSMFGNLWPDLDTPEIPITSVTNGVHGPTWIAPEMADLFTKAVLPGWNEAEAASWKRVHSIPDDRLWRAREQGRQRLVAFARRKLRDDLLSEGSDGSDLGWCDEVLDPTICTIGFARRFAPYKRATLLLSDPERLRALLLSPDHPMQLVFAGKAHPADEPGKQLIQTIVNFARDPEVRHRVVFLQNYDMQVGRSLYRGADIWLNTPRRPMEACGTSGMKAALNGALNCSVLDGWWDECFDGENGWAIPSAEHEEDLAARDKAEAEALFNLLEQQILPLFYDRRTAGLPREWLARVKHSVASLAPKVLGSRMVKDYTTDLYEPLAKRSQTMAADGFAAARELAAWKERVRKGWREVAVEAGEDTESAAEVGTTRWVEARVNPGVLDPSEIEVQLLHGPVVGDDSLSAAETVTMALDGENADGTLRFRGGFECRRSGRYGFAIRALPKYKDLASPVEVGLAAWAGD